MHTICYVVTPDRVTELDGRVAHRHRRLDIYSDGSIIITAVGVGQVRLASMSDQEVRFIARKARAARQRRFWARLLGR